MNVQDDRIIDILDQVVDFGEDEARFTLQQIRRMKIRAEGLKRKAEEDGDEGRVQLLEQGIQRMDQDIEDLELWLRS